MDTLAGMEEKIMRLPVRPGVYIMKDGQGDAIYIGKAKNLRNRVRSYFNRADDSRYLIRFLKNQVADIDCIITDTEKEALILENSLIKKHKPLYNVNLKDDKTYFSLRLKIDDRFPRLSMVRKIKKDGASYFGPYSSSNALKDTVKMISKTFLIRTCTDSFFNNRIRPCLLYQIKRCSAPCCGLIDEENYTKCVKEVVLFLEGRKQELFKLLLSRMKEESDSLNFEEAARIRDQISSIEKTIEKQKMVSFSKIDRDVFAFHRDNGVMELLVMIMRGGVFVGTQSFTLTKLELTNQDVLSSFLKQYYDEDRFIPQEILIPAEIEDRELVEEWFSEKKGKKVKIHIPQKGEKFRLIKMVTENAKNSFLERQLVRNVEQETLEEIQKSLSLKRFPLKIECFDISNISGILAVGSMVSFREGRPEKQGYRHFKIKTVDQADDCKMMYEVVKRRYSGLSSAEDLPDLVIVDGGKGQLNAVMRVFKELKIDHLDAAGLAKGEDRDKVFIPRRRDPILFKKNSKALFLLQQIRDEAHRFAITYHQKLRKRQSTRSILDDIPGVGSVRKKALLKHFGSLKKIKEAQTDELREVSGINKEVAQNIFDFFRNLPKEPVFISKGLNTFEPSPWSHQEEQY